MKTKWFGVFIYDDEIIDKRLFPKDEEEIAERIYRIQKGEIIEEERELSKYKAMVDDKRLASIGKFGKVKKIEIKAEDFGYTKDLLLKACIKLAMKRIEEEQKDREKRISEAIDALDDLIKISNMLIERLRNWFNYFVIEEKKEEKEILEGISNLRIGDKKIDVMEEESIKNIADIFISISDARKKLENYIKNAMQEIAPNVSKIIGHGIAARLIAMAGGIERLAMMPSGTIQVLGAEKALFKHIKDGSLPPKHGVIFQHEMINKAPRDKRGKIARLLATKIAIAAKADAFTGNYIADKLKKEIEKRYEEILKE